MVEEGGDVQCCGASQIERLRLRRQSVTNERGNPKLSACNCGGNQPLAAAHLEGGVVLTQQRHQPTVAEPSSVMQRSLALLIRTANIRSLRVHRSSVVISGHQWSSVVISLRVHRSLMPRNSAALSSTQQHSAALSSTHLRKQKLSHLELARLQLGRQSATNERGSPMQSATSSWPACTASESALW